MRNYIIVAPKFSKSGGVRTLYALASRLACCGHKVFMFAPQIKNKKYNFICSVTDSMRKNDVVVYPEVINGNPLGFSHVARYVLYYPGKLGGPCNFDHNEMLFVYNDKFLPGHNLLSIPCMESQLFYNDPAVKKDTDCYFVYKGGEWRDIPEFRNMIKIDAKWPEKREELAALLRRTKTLYSYDDVSLILEEASACGCSVKIVTKDGFKDYMDHTAEFYSNVDTQIENFINITQTSTNTCKDKEVFALNFKFIWHSCVYALFKYIPATHNLALKHFYKIQKHRV